MPMKKIIALFIVLCLLLGACAQTQTDSAESPVATAPVQAEEAQIIAPLPDTAMENLSDAILSVSLEEGDAYVDDNGQMQMALKIYSYDKYDMVDIARLKVGDTLVRHSGDVEILSLEQDEHGALHINGGLEKGGLELATDDCGIFFETGFDDVKSWYEVGEAELPVSADFLGSDKADIEQPELILYPGDFLNGTVTNYNFTPYNTTVRVEGGKIVELIRVYIP